MPGRNFQDEKAPLAIGKIKKWLGERPVHVSLTLGSGLGGFADNLPGAERKSYDIIGFPQPGVAGHAGFLHYADIGGRGVLILQGRAHYYEGHSLEEVVLPIRTLTMLGVKTHILTCAAGGLNPDYRVGEIVAISDHINLTGLSPLRGLNEDKYGPRFPDMTSAYSPLLREIAGEVSHNLLGRELEEGVYAWMTGPQYETSAEIKMLRRNGATLVGMSTVPEVIAARHMGAQVLALACVTNVAAVEGAPANTVTHEEVQTAAAAAKLRFSDLLIGIISKIPLPDNQAQ